MLVKIFIFLSAITFYAFSTNAYRLGFAGFSIPLPLVSIILASIYFRSRIYPSKKLKYCFIFLFIFIITSLTSSLINEPESAVQFLLKIGVCGIVFILTFAIGSNLKESEIRILLFRTSIFSAIFAASHTIYYYVFLSAPYLSISLDGVISEAGKNQLANYLGALFVLSFCVYQTSSIRNEKFLAALATISHLTALLYTFSRSALIVSLISISLFFFTESRNKSSEKIIKYIILIATGCFSLIVSANYLPQEHVEQFTENLYSIILFEDKGDSTSIDVRGNLISIAYNSFSHKPFSGNGPGSFVEAIGVATHNSYIQLLTESGLIGFISFIGFLIFAMIGPWPTNSSKILGSTVLFISGSLFFQNAIESTFIYVLIGLHVGTCSRISKGITY